LHLSRCDSHFKPPLSARIHIPTYAAKIRHKAMTVEAWEGAELIGLIAAYIDDTKRACYLTSISVLLDWNGRGVATALLAELMSCAVQANVESVTLEVSKENPAALSLYRKFGFEHVGERGDVAVLKRPVAGLANVPGRSNR